ncbi:hypothetical protein DFJ58DRAFT_845906 [Suillus subalutaceus]|uniref:uncharacterized protein n=1 Tax=Suillus subalutaceus TaxID=48586 RepID=UPI001B860AC9|nr:uncharacterized protein DFJ58DRAFT_845906 [Suillus subalutaceus]KAG1838864.1 hypothetical protein DFJ58DRAFT_845906 [Suillus subalutaceus]
MGYNVSSGFKRRGTIKKHELEEFKQCQELVNVDFLKWQDKESEYLGQVATKPMADAIAVAYIEQLKKLKLAEVMYDSVTSVLFLTYMPTNFTHTSDLNAPTHHHSKCWTPECPEYAMALKYFHECHFVRVVEELEGLVVQCLFELSKANLTGTGYQMCKYISKAIMRCSAAICSALEKYSAQAIVTSSSCLLHMKFNSMRTFYHPESIRGSQA